MPGGFVALLLLADEKLFEAVFVLLLAGATAAYLAGGSAASRSQRFPRLQVLGYGALLGASLAGTVSLILEIEQIV